MEGAPDGIDVTDMRTRLVASIPSHADIHHVQLRTLTPEQPLITPHATSDGARSDHCVLADIQSMPAIAFGLRHAPSQIERMRRLPGGCL